MTSDWRRERSQLPLWLPVFFGVGIGIYFALPTEPAPWIAAALLVIAGSLWVVWDRDNVRMIAIAVSCAAAGFAAIQFQTWSDGTRGLNVETGPQVVRGIVHRVEHRPNVLRIIILRDTAPVEGASSSPQKVRIRVAKSLVTGTDLAPGVRVRIRAVLRRPPPPAIPGGFDFQRHAYFRGLAAIGFGVGPLQITDEGRDGWRYRLERMRDTVTWQILTGAPSQENAVAAALLTGHRGHLDQRTLDIMRDAGIAHLLAISGLHIGLVAGLSFALIRAIAACAPRLSDRFDAKKAAAVCALIAALCYALLAGWTVPTQRAYVMICIILLAVLLDRRAVTLRGVAIAALVVLIGRPASVIEPGFQMSFAAVTALVAAYAVRRQRAPPGDAPGGYVRSVGRYVVSVMMASVIAGAATAPFAVYHFQHMAAFGLIANMLAVPIAAFWVMPAGMAALLLMPIGLEHLALMIMERGIGMILGVATWTADLPGAALDVRAFPVSVLACIVLGGLWLCLWQSAWRLLGVVLFLVGGYLAWITPVPDIIVDGDARVFAIRDDAGVYRVSSLRRGRFVAGVWLQRGGASGPIHIFADGPDASSSAITCEMTACVARRHGRTVSIVSLPNALVEDCQTADLVVALIPLRRPCTAQHVDRFDLWRNGTHTIYVRKEGIDIHHVRGWRGERPWTDHPPDRQRGPENGSVSSGDRAPSGPLAP